MSCFYDSHISYIVLSKIPFIKNGIFTTSVYLNLMYLPLRAWCGCQLLRFFQAALRGEKYHEALDAAERAIALTGGRTHWEVVGCSEGQFFLLPIRVHIKSEFEEVIFQTCNLTCSHTSLEHGNGNCKLHIEH